MNISYSNKATVVSLLFFALLSSSNSSIADVYRWRDSKGVMQYSDVPPASLKKNSNSESILLKIVKDDSLCANPDLANVKKPSNDPITLNYLFKKTNSVLTQRSAGTTTTRSSRSNRNNGSGFWPIKSSVSSSTPSGVSVAVIGTKPTTGSTSGSTTGSTSGSTTGSTSGSTTGSTSGSTTGSTSGSTTGSTSGSTTGSTSGSTTGSTSGSTTGSTSGSTSGSTTGSTSGSTTGSTTSTASIRPPGVAVGCNGNGEQCTIPAGVTAKVWYGVHTKWTTKENVTGSIGCNSSVMGDPKSGAYNRCFYVDNRLLEKNLDPKGQNLMPAVNKTLVPKASVGFSTPLIKAAATPKSETFPYAGAFRIGCEYSHMSNDDPIVFPGVPDATHHHTFFGNTAANAYSTNETLRNSGNSTCAGGILNRSGYWMPSLINTTTGAPAKPSFIVVYYKAIDEKSGMYQKAPPAGLRMIAGNARPLAVADAEGGFFCQDQTQVMNPANWGIMWQGNSIKQSCGGPNQMLRMIVTFPQCWDGKNLDSPDHKSHMAFACGDECENAQGVVTKSANSCPASHPIAIPNITINADFFGLDANAKYRLASDNYSTAYPGGYSLHADWMNGWDENTINRVVKNCLNNPKDCGGPNLGDGETLYGVNQD